MVTALCLTRLEFLDAAREDDRLTRVLDNTDQMMAVTKQMMAILPAILLVSNPFQSASGPSNLEAKQKAFDFKLKLLVYYFNRRQTTNHKPPVHNKGNAPSLPVCGGLGTVCKNFDRDLSGTMVQI